MQKYFSPKFKVIFIKKIFSIKFFFSLILILLPLTSFLLVPAQNNSQAQTTQFSENIDISKNLLDKFVNNSEGIPEEVLKEAKAIAIFPRVNKNKILFGKSSGSGIIIRKTESGWSAPVSFEINNNLTLGFASSRRSEIVLVFVSEESVNKLKEDKITLGREIAVIDGPKKSNNNPELPAQDILAYESLDNGLKIKSATDTKLNGLKLEPQDNETKVVNCGLDVVESLFIETEKAKVCAVQNESSKELIQFLNQLGSNKRCNCEEDYAKKTSLKWTRQEYQKNESLVPNLMDKLKNALNNEKISYKEDYYSEPDKAYILETDFIEDNSCPYGARSFQIKFKFKIAIREGGKLKIVVECLACSKSGTDITTTFKEGCNNSDEVAKYTCINNLLSRLTETIKSF